MSRRYFLGIAVPALAGCQSALYQESGRREFQPFIGQKLTAFIQKVGREPSEESETIPGAAFSPFWAI